MAASAAVLYGTRRHTWRTIGRFFSVTFPMAVWEARWFLLVSGTALFLPAIVLGTWVAHSHAALDAIAPPAVRDAYVNHDFASYYSSEPSVDFARPGLHQQRDRDLRGLRRRHHFRAAHPGRAFRERGQPRRRRRHVLCRPPAGGVLGPGNTARPARAQLGRPGRRGRAEAGLGADKPGRPASLASAGRQEARSAIVLVLGTVFTLAVSGAIEGFVTGSDCPQLPGSASASPSSWPFSPGSSYVAGPPRQGRSLTIPTIRAPLYRQVVALKAGLRP